MARSFTLEPGEKLFLGQTVMVNRTEGPATLEVEDDTAFVREKEVIEQKDATTPALRIYFPLLRMCLDGDEGFTNFKDDLTHYAGQFLEAVPSSRPILNSIGVLVAEADYRGALDQCFALLEYEEYLLSPFEKGSQDETEAAGGPGETGT